MNVCQLCGVTSHSTGLTKMRHRRTPRNKTARFHSATSGKQYSSRVDKDTDRLGRHKVRINGTEVCNNLNNGMCQYGELTMLLFTCVSNVKAFTYVANVKAQVMEKKL